LFSKPLIKTLHVASYNSVSNRNFYRLASIVSIKALYDKIHFKAHHHVHVVLEVTSSSISWCIVYRSTLTFNQFSVRHSGNESS